MTSLRYQMYYKGYFYASYGKTILRKKKDAVNWDNYLIVEELNTLNSLNIYNRLFREGIHNFYKINDYIDVVILKGKIQFYVKRKLQDILIIEKGSKPLRQGIVFKDDCIIYSEYHGNKERKPINIYKYNFLESKREILYSFVGIRHIHSIQEKQDNPNIIYVGTGDLDEECGIFTLNLKNSELNKVGAGCQIWRTVSILQANNKLFWGTDDPDGKNYIVKYDIQNDKLEKIKEIAGPAYYSSNINNNEMIIATTIEDRKKHRAIIYKSSCGEDWKELVEFKKDVFHTKYFGYGLIEFINKQESLNNLYYNLIGLKK